MTKDKLKTWYSTFVSILFGLVFFFLPVSSLSILSKLSGGTAVAPLSALPAFLLVVLLVIPGFIKRPLFTYNFKPLFLFLVIALLSTFVMFFREIPSYREASFFKNALEGFLTLLMGISFYYLCAHFIQSEEKLKSLLKWMYAGFFLLTLVSIFQAFFMHTPIEKYPSWLARINFFFSSSGKIYPRRINGLAFEPSWLAHQLNLLYIPVSLGFILNGYSIFKIRFFKNFTIEHLIFLTGVGLLFLSFSRIGWLTFLVLLVYLMIKGARILIGKLIERIESKRTTPLKPLQKVIIQLGLWLGVLLIAMCIAVLMAFLISKLDPIRNKRLFDLQVFKEMGLYGWANLIQIAERLIYWMTGFNLFLAHPWIGVGIGAVGFYFADFAPSFGYMLPEVIDTLNRQSFIPNAKNLWARLLAETGIIGFALFVVWVYTHWKMTIALEKNDTSLFSRAMATIGKLFIIAFVVEGFSMDTFGLPYFWVAFGLLVASWRMLKIDQSTKKAQNPLSTTIAGQPS